MGHLRQSFISKCGKRYFKKGQRQLFQSGSKFISKWSNFFKVGQMLFQNGAVTSKWGKMLFQSAAVISKWANYFKAEHNKGFPWMLKYTLLSTRTVF